MQRNFHAERPNMLWLTDITEFHIPVGKVYLSLLMDCFDGMPVAQAFGIAFNAELANTSFANAIATLQEGEHPIVHSDRGCHYQWDGWKEEMDTARLTRSMSKKGCSPDKAACEGFFGMISYEMFYDCYWNGVQIRMSS